MPANRGQQIQVIRVRQTIVEHHRVERLAFVQRANRRRAVAGLDHHMAHFSQRLGQRPPDQRLVVHDEHAKHRGIFRRHREYFRKHKAVTGSCDERVSRTRSQPAPATDVP